MSKLYKSKKNNKKFKKKGYSIKKNYLNKSRKKLNKIRRNKNISNKKKILSTKFKGGSDTAIETSGLIQKPNLSEEQEENRQAYKKSFIKLRNIICKILTDIKINREEPIRLMNALKHELNEQMITDKQLKDAIKTIDPDDQIFENKNAVNKLAAILMDLKKADESLKIDFDEKLEAINREISSLTGVNKGILEETAKNLESVNKKLDSMKAAQFYGQFITEFNQMVDEIYNYPDCKQARKDGKDVLNGPKEWDSYDVMEQHLEKKRSQQKSMTDMIKKDEAFIR